MPQLKIAAFFIKEIIKKKKKNYQIILRLSGVFHLTKLWLSGENT